MFFFSFVFFLFLGFFLSSFLFISSSSSFAFLFFVSFDFVLLVLLSLFYCYCHCNFSSVGIIRIISINIIISSSIVLIPFSSYSASVPIFCFFLFLFICVRFSFFPLVSSSVSFLGLVLFVLLHRLRLPILVFFLLFYLLLHSTFLLVSFIHVYNKEHSISTSCWRCIRTYEMLTRSWRGSCHKGKRTKTYRLQLLSSSCRCMRMRHTYVPGESYMTRGSRLTSMNWLLLLSLSRRCIYV